MESKELLLNLIKADLRNARFIKVFEDADITIDYFYSGLEKSILTLAGYDDEELSEQVYQDYIEHQQKLIDIPVKQFHKELHIRALALRTHLTGE
jgi:hypothetical protein